MTPSEMEDWLSLLGDSDRTRSRILRDLIKYRRSDGMTPEDEAICKEALVLVESRIDTPEERRGYQPKAFSEPEPDFEH